MFAVLVETKLRDKNGAQFTIHST